MPAPSELDQSNNAYVSPSDTIMSPTTKKLNEMKGKRFASGKPQSLFAKTVGKKVQAQQEGQGQQGQVEQAQQVQEAGQCQMEREGGVGEGRQ